MTDDLTGVVDAALSELRNAQFMVVDACRGIAHEDDPGGAYEQDLHAAMARRRECATALGMALLRFDSQGGTITLQSPEAAPAIPVDQAEDPVPEAPKAPESQPDDPVPEDPEAQPEAPDIEDVLSKMREEEQARRNARIQQQAAEDIDVDAILPDVAPEEPSEFKDAVVVQRPAPVSEGDLERLVDWSEGNLNGPQEVQGKPLSGQKILHPILDALGPPRRIRTLDAFYREIDLLRSTVSGNAGWTLLDREDQHALMGVVAARCRHLQDEASPALGYPLDLASLDDVFSMLTAFSAEQRPGFVLGLMREHVPEHGSDWIAEARSWWMVFREAGEDDADEEMLPAVLNPEQELQALGERLASEKPDKKAILRAIAACLKAKIQARDPRLLKMLMPHLRKLDGDRRFKSLRKNIRAYQREIEAEGIEADTDTEELPADWSYFNQTKGQTIILVGGDRRDKTAKRYRDVFGFSRVEWISGWEIRRLESIAKRVASGKYTAVIFLSRFLSHQAWYILAPVCKTAGTPFAIIERGYGVSQARVALERAFSTEVNGA